MAYQYEQVRGYLDSMVSTGANLRTVTSLRVALDNVAKASDGVLCAEDVQKVFGSHEDLFERFEATAMGFFRTDALVRWRAKQAGSTNASCESGVTDPASQRKNLDEALGVASIIDDDRQIAMMVLDDFASSRGVKVDDLIGHARDGCGAIKRQAVGELVNYGIEIKVIALVLGLSAATVRVYAYNR